MVSLVGNLACGRTSTKVKAATKNGAVAHPLKRKTEVKAKKGLKANLGLLGFLSLISCSSRKTTNAKINSNRPREEG